MSRNYQAKAQALLEGGPPRHPRVLSELAADAFWEVMRQRMELFGSIAKEAEL